MLRLLGALCVQAAILILQHDVRELRALRLTLAQRLLLVCLSPLAISLPGAAPLASTAVAPSSCDLPSQCLLSPLSTHTDRSLTSAAPFREELLCGAP